MGIKTKFYKFSEYEINKEKEKISKLSKNDLSSQSYEWAKKNLLERLIIYNEIKNSNNLLPKTFFKNFKSEGEIESFLDKKLQKLKVKEYPEKKRDYQKKLLYLLIKPSGPACNMRCEYCFYLEKSSFFKQAHPRMKINILYELLFQAINQGEDSLYFGWQGGEPTLMGIEFFKRAVEFQEIFGGNKFIVNTLQTNGTLLNKKWAKFLKEKKFLVGISLDGPSHVHDKYRKTISGKGSFSKIKQSTELLLEEKVNVNILATVNSYSVNFPEEIYKFLKSLGIKYIQFIPILEREPGSDKLTNFSVSPEKYGDFLNKIFDMWYEDFKKGTPISIRFFYSILLRLIGKKSPDCELQKECGSYLVVEYNGNVYSCDFFVDKNHFLGNINKDKLIDMLNSEKQISFGKNKAKLNKKCLTCKWLEFCYGGCPKNRTNLSDPSSLNILCPAYKKFFEHSFERLKNVAENLSI